MKLAQRLVTRSLVRFTRERRGMVGAHRTVESGFLVGPHQGRHVEVSIVMKSLPEMIRRARYVPEVGVMNMRGQFSDARLHVHTSRGESALAIA